MVEHARPLKSHDLSKFFSLYGKVLHVRIGPTGFGFVSFSNCQEAIAAYKGGKRQHDGKSKHTINGVQFVSNP